ncbi:MAG: HEAT repeat domain-containing protein [Limisphaerales bacterium]
MKPRFILILFIFGMLGVLVVCTREPRYHGKTLTSWLQQCDDTPLSEHQRRQEAQEAVRAIGAKKALPKLFNLIEAKNDPVSLWLIDKTGEFRIRFLRWNSSENYSFEDYERVQWHSAEDFQRLGIAGFEILGTNAAPAVEELGKLLNEKNHAVIAEQCLELVGKPAESVLCGALTNDNAIIRQRAIDALASVTDDVEVYIARIKPLLKDPSDAVRNTVINDIGIQTSAPELAVPILIGALNDSSVSANAASALANFGTNALVAFPMLTNLVSGGSNAASAAMRTLIIIAPDAAFGVIIIDCRRLVDPH